MGVATNTEYLDSSARRDGVVGISHVADGARTRWHAFVSSRIWLETLLYVPKGDVVCRLTKGPQHQDRTVRPPGWTSVYTVKKKVSKQDPQASRRPYHCWSTSSCLEVFHSEFRFVTSCIPPETHGTHV